MNYTEQAAVFGCKGESLIGVLSIPECAFNTAVVVVVGGPQYRAGSHRQFVLLARSLAAAGYAVLRFDYRGMGDSGGEQRNFEHVEVDVGAAINLVIDRVPEVMQVVVWGLCDAASAALLYCHETRDPRVVGLCLLNPWVRSEVGLARTHLKYHYSQRLMQFDFWARLLSGKVALAALGDLMSSLRIAATGHVGAAHGAELTFQQRMAAAWNDPTRSLLLILSGTDYTAKEFIDHASSDPAWNSSLSRSGLTRHDLAQVDHTFSDPKDRRCVEQLTLAWLSELTACAVSPSDSLALA